MLPGVPRAPVAAISTAGTIRSAADPEIAPSAPVAARSISTAGTRSLVAITMSSRSPTPARIEARSEPVMLHRTNPLPMVLSSTAGNTTAKAPPGPLICRNRPTNWPSPVNSPAHENPDPVRFNVTCEPDMRTRVNVPPFTSSLSPVNAPVPWQIQRFGAATRRDRHADDLALIARNFSHQQQPLAGNDADSGVGCRVCRLGVSSWWAAALGI